MLGFLTNLEGKIGHNIFVKTEKTEYLTNHLTYALFDLKFISPIKIFFEQILIFLISKMFQMSGSTTVICDLPYAFFVKSFHSTCVKQILGCSTLS